VPTAKLGEMWASMATAAAVMLVGVVAACIGGRR